MTAGKISAPDFPKVPAGSEDSVLGVQNGVVRLFPLNSLPSAANGFGIKAGPSVGDFDGEVMYIAHRGNASLFPESTMVAYRESYAIGSRVLEQDVQILSGGKLCVIHDLTVDSMTTASGLVAEFTPEEYKALQVDANDWHGSNFGNNLKLTLFDEVLEEFANRAIFAIEAKNATAMASIVESLIRHNIPQQQVILSVQEDLAAMEIAAAAGYPTMLATGGTGKLADAIAIGIDYIVMSNSRPDSLFTDWFNAGFKVGAFTIERRWDRDRLIALGCSFFYTDDVPYLSRDTAWARRDSWEQQRWMPGQLDQSGATSAVTRGRFYAPNYWGWDDEGTRFQLQGWACPINGNPDADTYNINFSVRFDSYSTSTRWAGVYLTNTDRTYSDGTLDSNESLGYAILMRASGQLQIYISSYGTTGTSLATSSGASIAPGEEAHYRIEVTPSQILVHRLDGPSGSIVHTATAVDSTYRGGYFHLGHNGAAVKFRNVIIS